MERVHRIETSLQVILCVGKVRGWKLWNWRSESVAKYYWHRFGAAIGQCRGANLTDVVLPLNVIFIVKCVRKTIWADDGTVRSGHSGAGKIPRNPGPGWTELARRGSAKFTQCLVKFSHRSNTYRCNDFTRVHVYARIWNATIPDWCPKGSAEGSVWEIRENTNWLMRFSIWVWRRYAFHRVEIGNVLTRIRPANEGALWFDFVDKRKNKSPANGTGPGPGGRGKRRCAKKKPRRAKRESFAGDN